MNDESPLKTFLNELLFFLYPKASMDDKIDQTATSSNSATPLQLCYNCEGSGFVEERSMENMVLRKCKTFLISDDNLSECPKCGGIGYISK